MMTNKKLVLKYDPRFDRPYKVVKLVGSVEWCPGDRLTKEELEKIMDRTGNSYVVVEVR